MSAIRHVVFDIGKVLIRWEPDIPYRRLIPDQAARERFLAEVCNGTWLRLTDVGVTWAEAEDRLIARFPDEEPLIRAFRPHWPEMIPGPIDDSVAVLEEVLAAGHDVTGLTNFADDTFDVASERFAFLKRMRGITVSARVRLLKPDVAIFRRHAEKFGLEPAATLFVDDVMANVEGARAAGWNAEQFQDAERMRADLARYGVLPGG